jgi:hypothetical protein
MPTRPPARVDAYGKPLTRPTDARAEPQFDRATNREQVALLWARLTDLLHEALVRGWHGQLSIEVSVQDGLIQDHCVERVRRRRS